MHPHIVSPLNDSYVDFIGHTETMSDDLKTVFSKIQQRHLQETGQGIQWHNTTDLTSLWVNKARGVGIMEEHSSFQSFLNCPGCVEHMRNTYQRDVELFGYVPPVLVQHGDPLAIR